MVAVREPRSTRRTTILSALFWRDGMAFSEDLSTVRLSGVIRDTRSSDSKEEPVDVDEGELLVVCLGPCLIYGCGHRSRDESTLNSSMLAESRRRCVVRHRDAV